MNAITKGLLIGTVCGATAPALILAVLQFGDFLSDNYAFWPMEVKIFGFSFTATTLRGQALLMTVLVAFLGGIIGAIIGLFMGVAVARRRP